MRPWPGLGVVLDRAAGHVEQLEALDRAVIQVDVRERRRAEVRLPAHRLVLVDRARAPRAERGEAVVLGGDLDAPGLQVLDRVVGPVMAEGELERLQADRAAQQLMAQADPPDRLAPHDLAHRVDDVAERRGVAWSV